MSWRRSLVLAVVLGACGRVGFDSRLDGDGAVIGGDGAPLGDGGIALGDGNPTMTADAAVIVGTASCAGIKTGDPAAPSGVYEIDPDGPGGAAAITAFCDMATAGGGWTLVLSYVHKGGTNPPLAISTEKLPVLGADTLGVDESGTASFGHAAPSLVAKLPFNEARFSCRSSAHTRVLDFVTRGGQCLQYLRTGTGACFDLLADMTLLPGHTAMMPEQITHIIGDAGDLAMTENTFFKNTMPKGNWIMSSAAGQWECDAQAQGAANHTIHRVWVR